MKYHAIIRVVLTSATLLLAFANASAQRQMENLGRGVVAVRTNTTQVYVGWRLLGTDPGDLGFNLYRIPNGGAAVKLNTTPITNSCNWVDGGATLTQSNAWFVRAVSNGVELAASAPFGLPASAPVQTYLSIPMQVPPSGVTPIGENYTYSPNDCSVGDLDGDGEYEIVLKWDPSNSKDNSQTNYTGNVYIDAYKLNGTRLWRIDLGVNIRAGAHYTQFMVYDLDGDGRAELACKTAPGTIDGQSNYVLMPGDDPDADYRNTGGYILSGPEYLTLFNGLTGAAMVTTNYVPARHPTNPLNPTSEELSAIWGDGYGNRVDRFLACVAYLDGSRPSLVMCRGYYTRAVLAAWDWRNGQLTQRWVFDSDDGTPGNILYRGEGNHNLSVGDVDADGKDEIIYGACSINDDGAGLYRTGLGHGDALHVSDMDPDRAGLEIWDIHEPSGVPGADFRDASIGTAIFVTAINSGEGPGRGVAADVWAGNRGYEMWGAGGLLNRYGNSLGRTPGSANFLVWWDADFVRELEDGNYIAKYGTSSDTTLLTASGATSNNGTKSTPGLSADILGDWREEVIWRTTDNQYLRIYTTVIPATNRLYTLMHDPQYRCAIAWQNVAYNQPPHPGFYLGNGMAKAPAAPVSTANLAWRGGSGGNAWDVGTTANWLLNGVWTNDVSATFAQGKSVLFDERGAGNSPVNLAGSLAPASVTVASAVNYTFAGSGSLTGAMTLTKSGSGELTVANTNSYTGATFVSGGSLVLNGTLSGSPVTVENRSLVWGSAQISGTGCLGQGLTIEPGGNLLVGPISPAPGTLTISNQLAELGGVWNEFDLSDDPSGATKTNDRVNVVGNLVLTGTNVIHIHHLGPWLGHGVYPLITYSGTLTGGLTNLYLSGSFVQPVALTNPPGMIALLAIIPDDPPAAPSGLTATPIGKSQIDLEWTDNSDDEIAFLLERSTNNLVFAQIASLAANQTFYSDLGLLTNTTYYYRVRGTNLAGASEYSNTAQATTTVPPPLLTWRGDGTANVWDLAATANWFNGTNLVVYPDFAFVTFDNSGSNSPAISITGALQPGQVTVTGTRNYTLGGTGSIGGEMPLIKTGTSTLTVSTVNAFSGGTTIGQGTVTLGNTAANLGGLGIGPVTFQGGMLQFNGYGGNTGTDWGGHTNDWIVAAGQTGTVRMPPRFGWGTPFTSRLTGEGTLRVVTDYVRCGFGGNWSEFTGNIYVGPRSGTAEFRLNNAAGMPGAALYLSNGIAMYNIFGDSRTIDIGELTGAAGATLGPGNGSSANPTWRVGAKNTDASYPGRIINAGITAVTKVGAGTWTLTSSSNTYSGATTIDSGTLRAGNSSGSATGTGSVIVNGGGTLDGGGIIAGPVTVNANGTVAPGVGAGTLTLNSNLTLNAGAMLSFELGSTLVADKLVVGGDVALGGILNVIDLAGFGTNTYTLITYSGALTGTLPVAGSRPEGYSCVVNTNTPGQVRLIVQPMTQPRFGTATFAGGNVLMSGTGGPPGEAYCVLTSTNLALPYGSWTRLATNWFDAGGGFSFTNAVEPATPKRFYLLLVP